MLYRFVLFALLLAAGELQAQIPGSDAAKRRYQHTRKFLEYNQADCFKTTKEEADRAFRQGYWDDAAALYRAAKSCADADQNERQAMNDRIGACRDANEAELREKEQRAVKLARHAIAANRADDARELLRRKDRTTAFRLADFANSYIAPEDNPDCLQVLIDAWNYEASGDGAYSASQTPFCYPVANSLDTGAQLRFVQNGSMQRLYAFNPRSHRLLFWDMANLEPGKPVEVDTAARSFDVSPDRRTVLFCTPDAFLLHRIGNPTFFRLAVPNASYYAFDREGKRFFYYKKNENAVFVLDITDDLFRGSPGNYNNYNKVQQQTKRTVSMGPHAVAANVPFGVQGIAFDENQVWLGYHDRLLIYDMPQSVEPFLRPSRVAHRSFALPGVAQDYRIEIFPAYRTLRYSNDTASWYAQVYTFLNNNTDSLRLAYRASGPILAASADGKLSAHTVYNDETYQSMLVVYNVEQKWVQYSALLGDLDVYNTQSGAFSRDATWLACATRAGALFAWDLAATKKDAQISFHTADLIISADGAGLILLQNDSVRVVESGAPRGRPVYARPMAPTQFSERATGNAWFSYRVNSDSVAAVNWKTGKEWRFAAIPGDLMNVHVFDSEDRYFAFSSNSDTLRVADLSTGKIIGEQISEGAIKNAAFLPNKEQLIVQRFFHSMEGFIAPKTWSFRDGRLQVVRLHDYLAHYLSVSADGSLQAYSDGEDIRVFSSDNLVDEAIRINPLSKRSIAGLSFVPGSSSVAAAYLDGSVIIWDVTSGQAQLTLSTGNETNRGYVQSMRFSPDARRLYLTTDGGDLRVYDLDPTLIQTASRKGRGRLAAFTTAQIREYELDKALDFEGNFERLAASDDDPLIRSFLDFYADQAANSNNISRVRDYCKRAYVLYDELEEETKKSIRPVMLGMYANFHWKLLQRSIMPEAVGIAGFMRNTFGESSETLKATAHTALLNKDLKAATRHYVDWTLAMEAVSPDLNLLMFTDLAPQLREMNEYDLLSVEQKQCVCRLYRDLLPLGQMCNEIPVSASPLPERTVDLRWGIFLDLRKSEEIKSHNDRVKLLRATLEKAATLTRLDASAGTPAREKAVLALAEALKDRAEFEQGSALATADYKEATALLQPGRQAFRNEAARLSLLARILLLQGNRSLARGRAEDARRDYTEALQHIDALLQQTNPAMGQQYRNDPGGALLTQRGKALLYLDRLDEARSDFDEANAFLSNGLNSLYLGHAALLQNEEEEAKKEYEGILDEEQLGLALAEISWLADRYPAKKTALQKFAGALRRETAQRDTVEMRREKIDYAYANERIQYFFGIERYDSAYYWSVQASAAVESFFAGKESDPNAYWTHKYIDAYLNQTYYLTLTRWQDTAAMSRVVQYADKAVAFGEDNYYTNYYSTRLLATNKAHALSLRGRPGDRDAAIEVYRRFIELVNILPVDPWELLWKDFRDFYAAGVRVPDLQQIILAVKPENIQLSAEDWRLIGLLPPER